MHERIIFLYPSKNIGGAQLLFARLAKYIATETNIKVQVVDYEDGFIKNYLKDVCQVEIIEYRPSLELPNDSVTVTPLSYLADLRFILSKSSLKNRFLFWSIHPDNIKHVIHSNYRSIIRFGNKKLKAHLLQMASNKNIVFMDGATKYSFQNEVNGKIKDPEFLPIPIEFDNKMTRLRRRDDGAIAVGWLGRFSYDKVNSIKKIIRDIAESKHKRKIILHLIGGGAELKNINDYLKRWDIECYLPGLIQGDKLDSYLMEKVDIGIVMGTSCLEMSKLKIPTAIVDYSLADIPCFHGYDWFFESNEFSLGNDAVWGLHRRMLFDDLIGEFLSDTDNLIGAKCHEAAVKNHSINNIASKIVASIQSDLEAKDFCDIAEMDLLINPIWYDMTYRSLKKIRNLIRK